jgi:hypothetical protein
MYYWCRCYDIFLRVAFVDLEARVILWYIEARAYESSIS